MKKEINLKTSEEIFRTYYDVIVERSKGDKDLIKTEIPFLDCYVRGLRKSELMLVFGEVTMGKTAFVLQLAKNLVFNSKRSVLLFSPENSAYDVARRMIMADSGIRNHELYAGKLDESEWLDLSASCSIFSEADITVSDASYLPLDRLAATAEKAVKSGKADVILIDSLDYTGYSEKAAQKVKALKNIACANNVPVICTCRVPFQLNKVNKDAFIRKTGEHADIVMIIWRELYEERDKAREAYFHVIKNNRDQTGSFQMKFDLDRLVFTEHKFE